MILGLIIGRGPQSLLINFLSLCHVYIYIIKKYISILRRVRLLRSDPKCL